MPSGSSSVPPSAQDYPLFESAKAASYLGIPVKQLHRLRRRGEIVATRDGWRRWLFHVDDLTTYMRETEMSTGLMEPLESVTAKEIAEIIDSFGPPPPQRKIFGLDCSPITPLVDSALSTALDAGASDLHFEPKKWDLMLRYRVDGRLRGMRDLPFYMRYSFINRFKLKAHIDILRRPAASVGSFSLENSRGEYRLRASLIRHIVGEALVLHILDQAVIQKGLGSLGMRRDMQAELEYLGKMPGGLLLFAGTPGSGLTTTAYTLLNTLNTVERCIHTLEETTEYVVEGLVQKETYFDKDFDPRGWLRETSKCQPDILFLGAIRDSESAALAVEASQSGVLVMATLSAADAIDALRVMAHFGVAPEVTARCLKGIVGQRLIRRICPECREEHVLPASGLADLGFDYSSDEPVNLYRGAGCEACGHYGTKGRTGFFELLRVNGEIAELIRRDAPYADLYKAARANGMKSLRDDAFAKTLMGEVPLDEARRLTVPRFV